jgi:uncharacterized protein (DUF433 family)
LETVLLHRLGRDMSTNNVIDRIVVNPKIMVGKPIIRGTRLTVEYVLERLGHGATEQELLQEYPGLVMEDIHACMLFASRSLGSTTFMPLSAPQATP